MRRVGGLIGATMSVAETLRTAGSSLPAQRPYWNPPMESILGTEQMRALQLLRLQDRVRDLYERTTYWRRRLDENGARPDHLKSLSDWPKMVPPFTKADYRALAAEH